MNGESQKDSRTPELIISRQYHITLLFSVFVYIILQVLIGLNDLGATDVTIYDLQEVKSIDAHSAFHLAVGIMYVILTIQHAKKVIEEFSTFQSDMPPFSSGTVAVSYLNIAVYIMCASSSFLTSFYNYGGVFVDCFGVETVAAQWPAWIVTIPLMTYGSIAATNECHIQYFEADKLTTLQILNLLPLRSWATIALMLCSMVSGFLMNCLKGKFAFEIGVFFYGLTLFCPLVIVIVIRPDTLGFLKTMTSAVSAKNISYRQSDIDVINTTGFVIFDRADESKRKKVASALGSKDDTYPLQFLLFVVYPIFFLIHSLGITKIITSEHVQIAYLFASIGTKSILLDEWVYSICLKIRNARESETTSNTHAKEASQTLLRYLFNDLRNPLNTLTMGLSIVEGDKKKLTPNTLSALSMMQSATGNMGGKIFLNSYFLLCRNTVKCFCFDLLYVI